MFDGRGKRGKGSIVKFEGTTLVFLSLEFGSLQLNFRQDLLDKCRAIALTASLTYDKQVADGACESDIEQVEVIDRVL